MAKTKKEKRTTVDEYAQMLKDSNAVFVITPTSITPNEATLLRKELNKSNASFNVVKNTLFQKALEKEKAELKDLDFSGENAVVFAKDDASSSAKALYEFLKDVKKGEIKGGILDGQTLSVAEIEELANLPTKEVMIATTVRTIAAPLSNFVSALNANISNFVNVLKNISENKE